MPGASAYPEAAWPTREPQPCWGAGPEPRNCFRPRTRPAPFSTILDGAALALAVMINDGLMQVAVGAVQDYPASDVQLREDVLHVADNVGQLRGSDRAAAMAQ